MAYLYTIQPFLCLLELPTSPGHQWRSSTRSWPAPAVNSKARGKSQHLANPWLSCGFSCGFSIQLWLSCGSQPWFSYGFPVCLSWNSEVHRIVNLIQFVDHHPPMETTRKKKPDDLMLWRLKNWVSTYRRPPAPWLIIDYQRIHKQNP